METTSDALSQLKFIAQIRPGTKIHVAGRRLEEPSWLTSFSRWLLWPDRRDNAYDFLATTFTRSFEILNNYIGSQEYAKRSQARQILRDLRLALNGVRALKRTYADDALFCCKLETLKEEVEARIEEIIQRGVTPADSPDSSAGSASPPESPENPVETTQSLRQRVQPPPAVTIPPFSAPMSQTIPRSVEDALADIIPGSCAQ